MSVSSSVSDETAAPCAAPTDGPRRPRLRAALASPLSLVPVLGVLVLLAFTVDTYSLFQLTNVFALGLAVLSLNLLTGFSGQLSAGHGGVMAVAGYTLALVDLKLGIPYTGGIVLAGVLCFVVGLVLGLPSLRLRGVYLALVTLAFAALVPSVILRYASFTGGESGLPYIAPGSPVASLDAAQYFYLLALGLFAAGYAAVHSLVRSRYGRALKAVRDDELMATSNGVDVGRTKVIISGVSAGMAGIGGAVYQMNIGPPAPDTYTLTLSLLLLTASVVGGVRTLAGSLVGAAFIVFVPSEAAELGQSVPQLVYAVALLAAIYFCPDGVVGLAGKLTRRLTERGARR